MIHASINYGSCNLNHNNQANFFTRNILKRGAHLLLVPTTCIVSAIDAIIGTGASLAVILTAGKHKASYDFSKKFLLGYRALLILPYTNLLLAINPSSKNPMTHKGGLLSKRVIPLSTAAQNYRTSNNFITRHVVTRLTYVLIAVSSLVTRAVDGVIGALAATFSILCFGQSTYLNDLAFKGLQAPEIVSDLLICLIKCINPWALIFKKTP